MPIFFLRFLVRGLFLYLNFLSGPSPTEGAPSTQFEIGNISTAVPDLVSEAATFFARFEHVEVNDLDMADFWVLDLLIWTFMVIRYLRSALCI